MSAWTSAVRLRSNKHFSPGIEPLSGSEFSGAQGAFDLQRTRAVSGAGGTASQGTLTASQIAPWAPASGEIKNISLNTRTALDPGNDPLVNPNYPGFAPWAPQTPVGTQWLHMTDFCGAVLADGIGYHGTYMMYGGAGHSCQNPLFWVGFDLSDLTWKQIGNSPLPSDALSQSPNGDDLSMYPSDQFDSTWGDWFGNYSGWPTGFDQPGYNPPEGGHTRNSFVVRPASAAGNTSGQIITAWSLTGKNQGNSTSKGSFVWDCDTMLPSRTANLRPAAGSAVGGLAYFENLDAVVGFNFVATAFASNVDVLDCSTMTWSRRTGVGSAPNTFFDSTVFAYGDTLILINHFLTEQTPPFAAYSLNAAAIKAGTSASWATVTVTATTTWPIYSGNGLSGTVAFALCPENGKYYCVNRTHGNDKMWRLTLSGSHPSITATLDELTMTTGNLEARNALGSATRSYDYSRLHWSTWGRCFIWTGDYISGSVQALRPPDIS